MRRPIWDFFFRDSFKLNFAAFLIIVAYELLQSFSQFQRLAPTSEDNYLNVIARHEFETNLYWGILWAGAFFATFLFVSYKARKLDYQKTIPFISRVMSLVNALYILTLAVCLFALQDHLACSYHLFGNNEGSGMFGCFGPWLAVGIAYSVSFWVTCAKTLLLVVHLLREKMRRRV
jgi:hypothetical protein